jgi:hypothetical protein
MLMVTVVVDDTHTLLAVKLLSKSQLVCISTTAMTATSSSLLL